MPTIGVIRRWRLGRVASLMLLVALLASCGAGAGSGTKRALNPRNRATAPAAPRPVLEGDGIGSVKFGQAPAAVAARLGRLYGPPVGAVQIPHGYLRAACGFYWEVWDGLGAASNGRWFAAELELWFRNSRFVGYSYSPNNFETTFQNDWKQYAGHRMILATVRGLAAGDPLAHGRRIYGRSFSLTREMQGTPPNPRLERLPEWEASTASGRIVGGIGSTRLVRNPGVVEGAHGTANWTNSTSSRRSISGISAGVGPDTPC
jgi:hypothetical protein